jgi:hypothetical protein
MTELRGQMGGGRRFYVDYDYAFPVFLLFM